jgi:thiamine-phosphate pyrophosphorylase
METRISGRGPTTGLTMDARGGWLVSFEDQRISEQVMYQSFDEALLAGRRRAISEARLYFVCEARPDGSDAGPLLDAALRGGGEMVQLRDKRIADEDLVAAAGAFREAADRHEALFFLNDRPDLVAACDADGVHVGQEDMPVAEARRVAGPAVAVGLSTHSAGQFDAAVGAEGDRRADQISVGPIWATPTKEGRPAAGLELIRHAAAAGGDAPWFAIGGIDAGNIAEVAEAGARRVVVVRAIRDAADPEAAARELHAALD